MRRTPVLLAVVLLLAAACGDDDEEPATTEAPPETEAPPQTEGPVETEAPPRTDGGSTSGADAVGPIPTGDADSPWCGAARDVDAGFGELEVIDFSDPTVVELAYRTVIERVLLARSFVPPELAESLDLTIEGLEAFADELERVGWRFIDADLSVIDTAALETASDDLDRYNFYVCGIDNGYDPDASGDDDDDLTFDTDQTIRESVIESLMELGMDEQAAGCIADEVDFTTTPEIAELRALYVACGVPDSLVTDLFGG